MEKVTIYRFKTYNVATDEIKVSTRWATPEAILRIAHGEIIESTALEVDASILGSDIEGMTVRDWMPPRPAVFRNYVRVRH
jgi:hypothetical protein